MIMDEEELKFLEKPKETQVDEESNLSESVSNSSME
jgi:hypothetical protein